jgi:hypothetical protein
MLRAHWFFGFAVACTLALLLACGDRSTAASREKEATEAATTACSDYAATLRACFATLGTPAEEAQRRSDDARAVFVHSIQGEPTSAPTLADQCASNRRRLTEQCLTPMSLPESR